MEPPHSHFDSDLKTFIEMSSDPDMARLNFLRWLVEQSRLEHGSAGCTPWSAGSDGNTDDLKAA